MAASTKDNAFLWLCLYLIQGLGNVGAKNLLEVYGGPEAIFAASREELKSIHGIDDQVVSNILARKYAVDPEKEYKRVEKAGARIIPYDDDEYPRELRQIYDPPVLLFARGKKIPSEDIFVAVVGSRSPTPYGIKMAQRIGRELAEQGIHVVSGLARGIDGAAQWGCLQGRGYTMAVMGTGVDVVYPASNRKLFYKVLESGCVVSEFPMGTPPEPRNFPIRNRIISGVSSGVVVVEATKKSGSLITASQALEQGREVFAVPGSAMSGRSAGTHFLIKQGAKLVETAEDILEEMGGLASPGPSRQKASSAQGPPPDLSDEEMAIYQELSDYPVHLDELVRRTGLQPGVVSGLLMEMELSGLVRQLPGKVFVRA